MTQFDVVIVGARCAGAPLATMLARNGLRVCLLDRAHFPSETPSTHVIQPCGVTILDDLGVLQPVLAAGAVPLTRVTLVNDDVRIDGRIEAPEFDHPGLCVRRITLDALLVDAATDSGVDVRTGCRVTGLTWDTTGRVAGVETDRGPVSARLVVGADGQHSTVAASVGATEYLVTPPGRAAAWAYFSGAADLSGRLLLGKQGEYGFLASPTDGGLYMTALTLDIARQCELHDDRDSCFASGLARFPELAELLAPADRVGPIRVITKWHGYFRQSAGPGWVLTGDAGHFKDFTPGQGISDALRQARSLTETITAGFADGRALDDPLQHWWRWRDWDAYEMYWLAHDMGVPGASTPLVTAMLRNISSNPSTTARFLSVINHDLSPARLFTPGRMAMVAIRALRDRPDLAGATLREVGTAVKDQIHRTVRRRRLSAGRRGRTAA